MRSESSRPCGRAPLSRSCERLRPLVVDHGVELGVLLAVDHRVEPQHRRQRLAAELAEAAGRGAVRAVSAADVDPGRERPPARRGRVVDAGAHLAQAGHVGVRVEDHDRQARLEQQLLEHDAERVGLAGAGLAAEERVTVEAAGVERERHAGRQPQLADRQLRAPAGALPQPGGDLVRRRGADRGVVERRAVAGQDHALAARRADRQPAAHRRPAAASPPSPPRRRRPARAAATAPGRGASCRRARGSRSRRAAARGPAAAPGARSAARRSTSRSRGCAPRAGCAARGTRRGGRRSCGDRLAAARSRATR